MTVAVLAPAVPARVTSPVAKPVTASLNTTVKLMGLGVGRIGLAAGLVDGHRRAARRHR